MEEYQSNNRGKRLEEKLNLLQEDVKAIKSALLGDEYNKNPLYYRVEQVERKISVHEKIMWSIGGVSTFGALVLGLFKILQ